MPADPGPPAADLTHHADLAQASEQAANDLLGRRVLCIGTDLVDIAELRTAMARQSRFADRVFTAAERRYCELLPDPAERFAVRFAAKESVLKALGVGIEGARFTDIEVRRHETGQPYLDLTGRAAALAEAAGVGHWLISLSHSRIVAQAMVAGLALAQGA